MFGLPPWLLILILVLAWIPFFAAILMLLSRIGGWRDLVEKYPRTPILQGTTWRWQHTRLRRFVAYNGVLIVTASRDGVLLRMPFLFRPGHRPIFLPWSEVTITRSKNTFGKAVTLRTAGVPEVPIHITAKLAERLKELAGEAWREDSPP